MSHGSLDNPKSIGTNELIKQGAKMITEVADIVKNYDFLHKVELKKKKTQGDIGKYQKIIQDKPIDINQIIKMSNKTSQEVMSELLMLELDGKIKKISGNRYIKLEER